MINQNVDYALVGNNLMSYLLSHAPLKNGKKILLLDDIRFNYGDFFSNSLTKLDLELVKAMGEKLDLKVLVNIENYINVVPQFFYLGKKQVLLGSSAYENHVELARKFSQWFKLEENQSAEQFNSDFNSLCQSIAHKLIIGQKKYSSLLAIEQSLPLTIKNILENFFHLMEDKNRFEESEKNLLNSFVYLFRGYFQNRLSTTGSKIEIYHLLLSLLSPYYELDYLKLNEDLLEEYKKNGGEFKKLNLGDLKVQSGMIKGIELESFEGTIFPKKIFFIGGHPLGMPFKFQVPRSLYNCLHIEVKVSNVPLQFLNQKIVFSSSMKISTGHPLFEVQFLKDQLNFNLLVNRQNGTKIEFIEKKIIEELKDDLKFIIPNYVFDFLSFKMEFTNDIFIEDKNYKAYLIKEKGLQEHFADILLMTNPLSIIRPKNVFYLGPYNDGQLGTFSSLVEVWRWQQKL